MMDCKAIVKQKKVVENILTDNGIALETQDIDYLFEHLTELIVILYTNEVSYFDQEVGRRSEFLQLFREF